MILAMVLLGLNATNVSAFEVLTEDEVVRTVITEKDLVRAVDNFIILFDASGSMDAVYADTGKRRVVVAKEILQQRNKKLPELGWNAGLYLFTPSRPLYDMKRYNRREFGKAIDQLTTTTIVPPSRSQMMRDLDDLLSGLSGRTAVFLMTDGQFVAPIKSKTSPVMMAKELTAKYDVCLYVISSAQTPKQRANVAGVAAANECSRVIPFDDLYGTAEYVAGILMVLEDIYIFEEDTITRVVAARADDILYSFDSADLRSEFHQELDAVGNFMRNNPDTRAIIAGYADSVGDPEYNMHLSRRRAESVAEYLTDNFNIDSDRLPVLWYGKTNPVADNATAAGRAKNRRTEIVIGRTR
jgi:OOP family OmpA-OmpF porin